jgi:hypothetical protein
MQQEDGQDASLPNPAEVENALSVVDLERPEQAVFETGGQGATLLPQVALRRLSAA